MKTTVLIGHTGVLGSAIHALLEAASIPLICVDSHGLFASLKSDSNALKAVLDTHPNVDVLCAAGVIDPQAPASELNEANVELPLAIYRLLSESGNGHRFVTFGSIHENKPLIADSNAYIYTKAQLLKRREDALVEHVPWFHFQLHTLYGGTRIHPNMFLGQIDQALRSQALFEMSAGAQLREYHHVDDIAQNMLEYLNDTHDSSVIEFSSGDAISLRDLAEAVFACFGREESLQVGVRSSPKAEVYENSYVRTPELRVSRPVLTGVCEWLETRNPQVKP